VPVTGFTAVSSSRLWGAEATGTVTILNSPCGSLRLLAGFRYLDLDERLDDDTIIIAVSQFASFVPGTMVDSVENFHGRSQFYGGQIGGESEWLFGRFAMNLQAKVALGDSHERVVIGADQLQVFPDGRRVVVADSVLARATNINTTRSDAFAVVPEVGINLGYDVTHHIRAFAGYTFTYWSDVVRPGNQIDPVVNLNRTGGPARPLPELKHSDFWAQGVNFGVTVRY
jgi:hypothetical protein